jgi:hypothetical protein
MKNKKLILAVIAFVAVIAVFAGIYLATQSEGSFGPKDFTVTVIHADGTSKDFTYHTYARKLGAFLEQQGLIDSTGADEGMFHSVDGEKADWNINQSYWAFYLGEEYATTGIYQTNITDGTTYRLVYTIG